MTSTLDSQPPLRDKLVQVKDLLSNANQKLQEEASKYGIFATKTSAAQGSAAANFGNGNKQNNGANPLQDVQELKRTINDIKTMQSVLTCPIFEGIVNVTDSLSQLSHYLNLHPSIGPNDVDFDETGELILKPPIEPASFNNLINSRLDEFSENTNHSPNIINELICPNENFHNGINNTIEQAKNSLALKEQNQVKLLQAQSSSEQMILNGHSSANGYAQQPVESEQLANNLMTQRFDNAQPQPASLSSACPNHDLELLIKNGTGANGHGSKVASLASAFEANSSPSGARPLYKTNGHLALNQMVPSNTNDTSMRQDLGQARSLNQIDEQSHNQQGHFGYSNELYKTTHEFSSTEPMAIDSHCSGAPMNSNNNGYSGNIPQSSADNTTMDHHHVDRETLINSSSAQQLQSHSSAPNNLKQSRASPSTSAGSTVRLADECDSGTFSSRSQPIKSKLNFYSSSPAKDYPMRSDDEPTDSSIDQELIEKLSPEMKKIKVTLEKDNDGLGLTIAGYTCEEEEISGIFIKGIVPGSPAHRSGKIRILDQIFAVNGQEILGCRNSDAVDVLRQHTGRVVTLELMRYLADSKYRKLRSLLDDAQIIPQLKNATATKQQALSNISTSYSNVVNQDEMEEDDAHISSSQLSSTDDGPVESLSKSSSVHNNANIFVPHGGSGSTKSQTSDALANKTSDPLPVAAQRNATTNKIIETKQGARNKIDIKSPMCQTAAATYVNRTDEDYKLSTSSQGSKQEPGELDRLVRLGEYEWEQEVKIIELSKEPSQVLGFTVRDYINPKNRSRSIIMITSITQGGIAEQDGRLSSGDLLIFVDDQNLDDASLDDAVKALKRTSGHVRLGVLKLKQT